VHLFPQVTVGDPDQLREQYMGRSLATRLGNVSSGKVPGQFKDQFLESVARTVRVKVHALDLPRPHQAGSALVVGQTCLHLHLRGDFGGIKGELGYGLPVHGDAGTDGLLVALYPGEPDLVAGFGRNSVDVVPLLVGSGGSSGGLKRMTSKGTPKILATFSVSFPSSPTS